MGASNRDGGAPSEDEVEERRLLLLADSLAPRLAAVGPSRHVAMVVCQMCELIAQRLSESYANPGSSCGEAPTCKLTVAFRRWLDALLQLTTSLGPVEGAIAVACWPTLQALATCPRDECMMSCQDAMEPISFTLALTELSLPHCSRWCLVT